MSMLQSTEVYQSQEKRTDRKTHYGFVVALICVAVGLAVATAAFTLAPIGSGISDDTVYVGP